MFSTVAVGTDGSGTASKAVDAAADLARRYDAKVVLLSAFQDPGWTPRERSGSDVELQWALSILVDEGDPGDVIVRLAAECGADVLVIGNKGMQRRVLGSVPNTVTHKAPCSVLVVKTT
jgi:nucleotide-binding universal stress UspA family protein